MKLRWGIVFGLLVLAGCDSSFCTNRDVNGNCPEFDGPPDGFDATVRADGSVGDSGTVLVLHGMPYQPRVQYGRQVRGSRRRADLQVS